MRKLYLELYLAFVGIVLGCALAVGLAWRWFGEPTHFQRGLARGVAELVVESLPAPDSKDFQPRLDETARRLTLDFALFDRERRLLGSSTASLSSFPAEVQDGFFRDEQSAGITLELADGRVFVALWPRATFHRRFSFALALFGALMAIGCYPLARRITRRLEALREKVNEFGSGALATRASVRGRDEVAELAQSFNRAAEKIETLVQQEKRMLASASHEFRSPLARIRMALELLENATAERRVDLLEEAARDIEELDLLVEDLLLSVRAEGRHSQFQPVAIGELVKAEAARFGVSVAGGASDIQGDPRMLKRLVRNLIENATQHARGARIAVELDETETLVKLHVDDDGPGVPEAERERIFEPFYRSPRHDEAAHGGVGLGLALVRQIARLHGGRAWVEPRTGGGSRFIVVLARVADGSDGPN